MVRLKDIRDMMVQELNKVYPGNESASLVNILFSEVAGIDRTAISLVPEKEIDDRLKAELWEKLGELKEHKPVQYVTGKAYFFDLILEVNPSVLIPRPETEELVKWIADDNKTLKGLSVLDIGTGSGCIILALGRLLKYPALTAVDISVDAISTAARNSARLGVPLSFIQSDILDANQWGKFGSFDIIVSNPPYVRESEKALMQPNVLNYEPPSALFVADEDPLVFYRAIAGFAKEKLAAGGRLYLEINENMGEEVIQLLAAEDFTAIVLKKDLQGKDRLVSASRRCPEFINRH